jgi:hypothetical protein
MKMADQAGIKVSPKQAMDGAGHENTKNRHFLSALVKEVSSESEKEEKIAKTGSGRTYGKVSIETGIAVSAGVKAAKKSGLLK